MTRICVSAGDADMPCGFQEIGIECTGTRSRRCASGQQECKAGKGMTGHRELQCRIHPLGSLSPLRFVVVCAFENGRMLLSWHRGHRAWETQGGHIEANETPEEAARRELYEESGVTRAELLPVCDYYAFDSEGESNGRVFAARVLEREALPEYEMQKVQAFECLPEDLTYPRVTPVLFREAAERLRAVEP